MSDTMTSPLRVNIPADTYRLLTAYVQTTNGALDNEVARLLRLAIENRLRKYPNLRQGVRRTLEES